MHHLAIVVGPEVVGHIRGERVPPDLDGDPVRQAQALAALGADLAKLSRSSAE